MSTQPDRPAARNAGVTGADATGRDAPIPQQRNFWNTWNSTYLERQRGVPSRRQAELVMRWLERLGRRDLAILDVGCGSGWLSAQLTPFGRVTGTDLSDEVLSRARVRWPDVLFVAGDFMEHDFTPGSLDVIVCLEVLAHVADQPRFLDRVARLLRPGGHLMLATQNRFVLERSSDVSPRGPGQIRQWAGVRELRRLLQPNFEIVEMTSVVPHGDRGILRVVNSTKLNRAASLLVGQAVLDRLKERVLLGHTLMVLARPRRAGAGAAG
jgi:2-polyprenyl-3-methyl-5-hydroxy-6-metoxy-1,4-benzoquinol methylase